MAFKEQPLSEKHIHLFWKTGNSDSNKTKSMLENSTGNEVYVNRINTGIKFGIRTNFSIEIITRLL